MESSEDVSLVCSSFVRCLTPLIYSKSQETLLSMVQETFKVILDFKTSTVSRSPRISLVDGSLTFSSSFSHSQETLYRYTLEDDVRIDSQRDAQRASFNRYLPLRRDQELTRFCLFLNYPGSFHPTFPRTTPQEERCRAFSPSGSDSRSEWTVPKARQRDRQQRFES